MLIAAGWDLVLVEDCTFVNNDAANNGGGVYVNLPAVNVTLRRVELVDNEATRGGAVFATGSELVLENTLFDGNTASTSGGALYLDNTAGRLTNAVAWSNVSAQGAGLVVTNGRAFTVNNSVFARNTTGSAILVSSGVVPTVQYSDFNQNTSNFSGMPNVVALNGNRTWVPRFTSAAAGNFTLLNNSQLINRGDPAILDVNGTRSDIGLYGGPRAF
jgi:predicted outer membrane repeat protein